MTEFERLRREKDGYKTDLDRIALVVYPDKQEWFTYSVDFVIEEIKKLRADRDAWEACVREAAASKSPCGHSAQYAYTPDGKGKVILCYACKLAAAEAALTGCISAARSWRSDQLGLLFPKDRNNPDFHVDEQRESKLRAAIDAAKTEQRQSILRDFAGT